MGFPQKKLKAVEICFAYQPISGFIRNNLCTDPVISKREAVGNLNERFELLNKNEFRYSCLI